MKILLVSGHTSGHNACKATGVNEGDLNIELVKRLKLALDSYADVDVYPYDRDMYIDNKNGAPKRDMRNYNYVFEVHFNSGGGSARGTSVQLHTNYKGGISVEQAIANNLAGVGFKKRGTNGIVRRNDLLNMNTALRLGVDYALLETCFYDNAADMVLYNENKALVATAISQAIIDRFGLKKTVGSGNAVEPVQTAKTAKVTGCSVLNVRATPNGIVLGCLQQNDVVQIVGSGKDSDGDTWTKIRYGRLEGYVWPKYIK